jgi:hypothetical protein
MNTDRHGLGTNFFPGLFEIRVYLCESVVPAAPGELLR